MPYSLSRKMAGLICIPTTETFPSMFCASAPNLPQDQKSNTHRVEDQ